MYMYISISVYDYLGIGNKQATANWSYNCCYFDHNWRDFVSSGWGWNNHNRSLIFSRNYLRSSFYHNRCYFIDGWNWIPSCLLWIIKRKKMVMDYSHSITCYWNWYKRSFSCFWEFLL